MIVKICKEQYLQTQDVLKKSKKTSLLQGELIVTDCIDNVWGVYRVKGAWKSLNVYKANMELIKAAQSEEHAKMLSVIYFEEAAKKSDTIQIIDMKEGR